TARVARFLECFQHVAYKPRYAVCSGVADLLEPAEEQTYEADFLDYIRGLSQKERRAFDIAMGFVFSKVSDRRVLFSSDWTGATSNGQCLDRSGEVIFDDGWYEPAMLPPVARSMGKHAR